MTFYFYVISTLYFYVFSDLNYIDIFLRMCMLYNYIKVMLLRAFFLIFFYVFKSLITHVSRYFN